MISIIGLYGCTDYDPCLHVLPPMQIIIAVFRRQACIQPTTMKHRARLRRADQLDRPVVMILSYDLF